MVIEWKIVILDCHHPSAKYKPKELGRQFVQQREQNRAITIQWLLANNKQP